jgi:hypothetical protein
MQIDPTAVVTMTAACELGRHGSCRGVVFSLTTAHLADCACACHDPAPVDPEQELENLLEAEADRRLDDVGVWA